MSKGTRTFKRWRIDIGAELDLDAISRAARAVEPADLRTGETHGLLLHEVHISGGRTKILASASAAAAKAAAQRLKAGSRGATSKVTAARTGNRR
jgi:hypothetical protein